MTDEELRASIISTLSPTITQPHNIEVSFDEIGDVFVRVDVKDLHWSQNVGLKPLEVDYHPREEVERHLEWYCTKLSENLATAMTQS